MGIIMSKTLTLSALVAILATSTSTFAMHHITGGASSAEKAKCAQACHGKHGKCVSKCEKYATCMRKNGGNRQGCGGKFDPDA